MRLGDGGGNRVEHDLGPNSGSGSQSDHETVAPLPPPPPMAAAGWPSTGNVGPPPPPPAAGYLHTAGAPAYAAPSASMASGYAPVPFQSFANYETATGGAGFQLAPLAPGVAMAAAHSEVNSASGGSATSSGSEKAKKKQQKFALGGAGPSTVKDGAPTSTAPNAKQQAGGAPSGNGGKVQPRAIGEVQADLSGSRASFRNAMNNPCEFSEFFVDVM